MCQARSPLCGTMTGRALTLRAGGQGQDGRPRNTGIKPPPGLLSHRFAVYNGAAFCSPSAALTSRSLGAAEIPRLPPKATEVGAMRTALGVKESTAAPKVGPTRRILFCKYNKRTQSKHVQLDQRVRMIAETRKRGSRRFAPATVPKQLLPKLPIQSRPYAHHIALTSCTSQLDVIPAKLWGFDDCMAAEEETLHQLPHACCSQWTKATFGWQNTSSAACHKIGNTMIISTLNMLLQRFAPKCMTN